MTKTAALPERLLFKSNGETADEEKSNTPSRSMQCRDSCCCAKRRLDETKQVARDLLDDFKRIAQVQALLEQAEGASAALTAARGLLADHIAGLQARLVKAVVADVPVWSKVT
jgi:hypothetical protein